jgi:high-affinity Fe2+/Pb2+ permease
MTEMLINQIGKISNNNDKGFDLKHLNSYNLSLGFAIGLINLGHGKMNSKHENNYEEKIFSMIYLNNNTSSGNTKSTLNIIGNNINNNRVNNNNQNNKMININQTTPAGFACLTLYYLQTKNSNILSKIKTPENLYQLDSFKPFHLYLAILCKNLISWDNITSSINWVKENIPNFIQFLHESSLADISDDINYNSKINLIDFSQVSTCYFYSLSAGLMSLGFKYCGTNNNDVCKIIIYYIKNVLLKATVVNDIIIRENVKFEESNKRAISKRNRSIK